MSESVESIGITISEIPTPPSTSSASKFDYNADLFLGALPTLRTELNAFIAAANAFGLAVVEVQNAALEASVTVTLDNTMTLAEMQALIDAVPKNLNGFTLTIQFADGNYSFGGQLYISCFHGGSINVLGKSSDNTASSSKAVNLASSNNSYPVIRFNRCKATIAVSYIRFYHTGGSYHTVYADNCPNISFTACAFTTSGYTSILLYLIASSGRHELNFFTYGSAAIALSNARNIIRNGNACHTTYPPTYGVSLMYGSKIAVEQADLAGATSAYSISSGSMAILNNGTIKISTGTVTGA